MNKQVGLIGIGEIGSHFAKRLLVSSYSLTAFDIDPSKLDAAVAMGAEIGGSPMDVAQHSKIILLSLTDSSAVDEVLAGRKGLLEALRPGQLVVDTGTSRPSADAHWAEVCAQQGAGFIDAPVTWRGNRLLMLAGAAEEHFAEARDILECISSRLEHVGPVGSGHRLKLVNQLILLGQMAVQAESVEFARHLGLDPHLIRDVLELHVPEPMFGNDFRGPGHIALGLKDLGYILEAAREVLANAPLTGLVHEVFKATARRGSGRIQPAIVTYWRSLNG